ncbi:Transposon TX1 uncharacterized [Quillaja saponaria]|uniref:Transposon TX1 uncharacterized n=1 Tax=Quillaja saponaria TaxID=32244 RepID=A0AAD7LF10_QUISA|nr:Transposon TX1 uncharacterized [Quillaja saponaria]
MMMPKRKMLKIVMSDPLLSYLKKRRSGSEVLGGPWLILDHYLTIRPWEPNFDSLGTKSNVISVWVRFPGIRIEYHDSQFLTRLAERIAHTVILNSVWLEVSSFSRHPNGTSVLC